MEQDLKLCLIQAMEIMESNKSINKINILDVSGRSVKTLENLNDSRFQLDLTDLYGGVYFINVSGEGFNEQQKVVINK